MPCVLRAFEPAEAGGCRAGRPRDSRPRDRASTWPPDSGSRYRDVGSKLLRTTTHTAGRCCLRVCLDNSTHGSRRQRARKRRGPTAQHGTALSGAARGESVGAAGLEPTTTGTPYRCATKLRHAPTLRQCPTWFIIASAGALSTRLVRVSPWDRKRRSLWRPATAVATVCWPSHRRAIPGRCEPG